MDEKEIKGALTIRFSTDGDFGFSNLDEIASRGWIINKDTYKTDYTFKLDFTGNVSDLRWRIIEDLFENVHSHKTYVMRSLCSAFEQLENNCDVDNMECNVHVDMGNQSIDAEFMFDFASEVDILALQVERLQELIKQEKEQIKCHENRVSKYMEMRVKAEKRILELCEGELHPTQKPTELLE